MSSWMRGDEAVCIAKVPWRVLAGRTFNSNHPVEGGVYRVTVVKEHRLGLFLQFAEFPNIGYRADAFRKATRPTFDFRQHITKKEPEHA